MANDPQKPKSPPEPKPPSSVSHLALAAIEAHAPKRVVHYRRGDVIKHAGEVETALFIVSSGRVSTQRDIKTPHGVRSESTDLCHKGDPFNYGWFFASTNADTANRYVAETDDTSVIILPAETYGSDSKLFEKTSKKFLATITRHGAGLRDALVRVVADKLESDRYACELDATFAVEQQVHKEEIERLKRSAMKPPPSELDALEIGDSLQIAQLKAQVTDLLREVGDERNRSERYKGIIAQLRPIAEQKGHEAAAQLAEDERIAKAIVALSNYFFGLVRRELTGPEVDEVRRLIRDVHPQWSDERMAAFLDAKKLVGDIAEVDRVEHISSLRPEPPPLPASHAMAPTRREGGPPPLPFNPKVTPAPSEAVKPESQRERPAWRKSSPGEYSIIESEDHPPTQRAQVWPSDGPGIEFEEVPSRRTLDWREFGQQTQQTDDEEPVSRDTLLGGMTGNKK